MNGIHVFWENCFNY